MLYRDYGKRLIDVVVSACALIIASPFLAVAGLAVVVTMGRPVLFCQQRAGRNEAPITVLKLRTMSSTGSADGASLPEHARITPVGRALRRWSIDELPQLWNVLRGDMSLIGPRPLLPRYGPFYTAVERRRFSVRPGISGWAQVNGRNDSPWDERLRRDVWYVDKLSLPLDLKIAALTVRRLVSGEGFHADPRSTLRDLDHVRRELSG